MSQILYSNIDVCTAIVLEKEHNLKSFSLELNTYQPHMLCGLLDLLQAYLICSVSPSHTPLGVDLVRPGLRQ